MAYHQGGEGGRGWLSAKVLKEALWEDEKRNIKKFLFLDVTLNLNSESYYPYRTPNDHPVYVHTQFNHPRNIIKNLPASLSRRLIDISSDETAFGDAKPIYDKALADSGFCEMTEFLEDRKSSSEKRKRKNRRQNIAASI